MKPFETTVPDPLSSQIGALERAPLSEVLGRLRGTIEEQSAFLSKIRDALNGQQPKCEPAPPDGPKADGVRADTEELLERANSNHAVIIDILQGLLGST